MPRPAAVYDHIGVGYTTVRRPDPRLASAIAAALGDAGTVADIGAGSGSYEPPTTVVAIDPSPTMLAQRPTGSAPAVRGVAEALPLADDAVDAALAVLTLHHWDDWQAGVAEMRRVAGRVVVVTWDEDALRPFWLFDYLPEARTFDERRYVPLPELVDALGGAQVIPWPVPRDCRDGFLCAYWARPERYLDPATHAGMSVLRQLPDATVERGMRRLRSDLADGTWHRRHGRLLDRDTLEIGYRILVSRPASG